MAKIKGFELKGVKVFTARNGYGLSANIYLNNKKIGTAYDAGNGGAMDIFIEKPENRSKFSEVVETYYRENPSTLDGENGFIDELAALKEIESVFKKNEKKGYPITIALSFNKRNADLNEISLEEDIVLGLSSESAIQMVIDQYNPFEYTIYRSLKDFIIE